MRNYIHHFNKYGYRNCPVVFGFFYSLVRLANSIGIHMYRVLHPRNFPNLDRPCRECNRPMVSTGQLFFKSDEPPESAQRWFIVFVCPLDGLMPVWAQELTPFIFEHTTDVDPAALPVFGKPAATKD